MVADSADTGPFVISLENFLSNAGVFSKVYRMKISKFWLNCMILKKIKGSLH